MVIFGCKEDYDVTAGFLAATYELFYESFRNILIEGTSRAEKKRLGSALRGAVREMQTFPSKLSDLEKSLQTGRSYFYSHNDMLGFSTPATFMIGWLIFPQVTVCSLALFTVIDGLLQGRPFAIGFCICVYVHVLLLMVVFRIKEDFDALNGFLASAFAILYKSAKECESWDQLIYLVLGFVVMAYLKNYLVGGKGAELLDDRDLPQGSDRRRRRI
ncbi:unnamed protein product [Microthlaspi erraticum]|uniref:Uncharacterized protein n=1 Tax=Microthlaspi erraticum TaxID=1685480 RepID=A0A6D2I194_9BRAS|nr:unnamed protein product [Microthlaspi erraticum]